MVRSDILHRTAARVRGTRPSWSLITTASLRRGPNRLVVRVDDEGDGFDEIPHGKQSWYGMLSGIWQQVWLAVHPRLRLTHLRVRPDPRAGRVSVQVGLSDALILDDMVTYLAPRQVSPT